MNEQDLASFIKAPPQSGLKDLDDSYSFEHPFKQEFAHSKLLNDSNQSLSLTDN